MYVHVEAPHMYIRVQHCYTLNARAPIGPTATDSAGYWLTVYM